MRLSGKSCLGPVARCDDGREKVSSGREAARASAGDCGVEDQVGRTDSSLRRRPRRARRELTAETPRSKLCNREVHMEVVVTGRHCELSDRFRSHVEEKLTRLEKHDHRIIRVNVEVENERNPRQADRAVRRRADRALEGAGDPGRGLCRRQDGRAGPGPRQDGRADAPGRRPPARPPRAAHPGLGGPGARRRRRRRGHRGRRRRHPRPPGRPHHGDRRRAARGPREDPRGRRR